MNLLATQGSQGPFANFNPSYQDANQAASQPYNNPMSSNNFVSTNPALNQYAGNIVGNNVLGASTQVPTNPNPPRQQQQGQSSSGGGGGGNNSGGGGSNNDWMKNYAGWDPAAAAADHAAHPDKFANQGGGGNTPNQGPVQRWEDQISNAYKPQIQAFKDWQAALPGMKDVDVNQVNTDLSKNQAAVEDQRTSQLKDLQNQIDLFNQQAQTSKEQSNRSYNITAQNALNRFGGGDVGSIGPATQQVLLQLGEQNMNSLNINQQTAQKQFILETSKANQFFDKQHNDLSIQAQDAIQKISDNFRQQSFAIQGQIGQTEAEKTNAMLGLLKNTIDTAQKITDTYNANRQNILGQAAGIYTQILARGGNSAQAASALPAFFRGLNNLQGQTNTNQAALPTDTNVQNIVGNLYGGNKDVLSQLIGQS